ncbi:hypothetical protein [Streptomyces sp. NPDC059452]|uniref:hypothetical protein n=1 Tax=Streptomyces sp. NPDC059452 TaxID=3346835 RepID=UPI00369525F4
MRLLREDGFQGPRWDLFVEQCFAYGQKFLHKAVCTGHIFRRCDKTGRPVGTSLEREVLREHAAEREMLVDDAVATAVNRLREQALLGGNWQPELGSSLRSYFIGGLVHEFPNAFRRWRKQWKDGQASRPVDHHNLGILEQNIELNLLAPPATDPAHHAVVADQLERILRTGDHEIATIADMRKAGQEWDEIGRALGKSGKAAHAKWSRFCLRVRQQQPGLNEQRDRPRGTDEPESAPRPPRPHSDQTGDRTAEGV